VQLLPKEFDTILVGLLQGNWIRLAEPLPKYDPEVVCEFYVNSWTGGQGAQEMRSKVRGKWVHFDRDSISEFLGNPLQLQEGDKCTYQNLKAKTFGFNDQKVARKICIANCSYQVGPTENPLRILRKDMKTISQVWMIFMLSNMVPIGHVFYLNMPKCHLLYSLLKENYTVDVEKIICDEIYKFITLKVNNQESKGSLGFPVLITTLCQAQGI